MSSPYDESLLASAPKATKSQLQSGYNPDLLVEKTSSTPTSAVDPEIANLRSPVVRRDGAGADFPLTEQKVPFYRTKKGIIIIITVLFIVIIAVVVGGAVGGTRKKKSITINSNGGLSLTSVSTTTSISGGAGNGQGAGLTPTASSAQTPATTFTSVPSSVETAPSGTGSRGP